MRMDNKKKVVKILYTNYRGETAIRTITPEKIWFGETEWHPGEQWLLDAFDLEKQTMRSFAMKDIKSWVAE
jgi:predicted DNA-binding transcriptional regulator YafY